MSRLTQAATALVIGVTAAGMCLPAVAQDTSKRPVRLLVPSPPGGPSDFAARLIAPGLSEALGRNVVVDARQSVNGILSMEVAAKSAPDGATLAIGNSGTHIMNPGLYRRLPYDPVRDFVPISQLISAGSAFVACPRIAPATFGEFLAAAKKEPGRFNVGIAGAAGQVNTEILKSAAGIVLNNVPYKGSSPTEIALMSGEIDVALISIPVAAPYARAGRMKPLAVITAKRSPMLPEVPTAAESGLEGLEFGNWHALFAPAGTPDKYVRAVHRDIVRIFQKREIRDIVVARGSEIIAGSPEELAALLRQQIPRYRRLMAEAGIQPQ